MIQHLKKYLGLYIIVPSIYLAFAGQSEIWLVIIVCLFKIPPFDFVGRYEDWLKRLMMPKVVKAKKWRDKQSKPVKVVLAILALVLITLWVLLGPECILC